MSPNVAFAAILILIVVLAFVFLAGRRLGEKIAKSSIDKGVEVPGPLELSEGQARFWEVLSKWAAAGVAAVAAWSALETYGHAVNVEANRQVEAQKALERQKNGAEDAAKQNAARERLRLDADAALALITMSSAPWESPEWKKAKLRFDQLLYGELGIVGSGKVLNILTRAQLDLLDAKLGVVGKSSAQEKFRRSSERIAQVAKTEWIIAFGLPEPKAGRSSVEGKKGELSSP